jgi:amino-acid N-acetyltransferase
MRIEAAHVDDVTSLSELNNRFSPEGLTLPRSETWVLNHIDDYRVVRDEHGRVLGSVCLDDYSPSLVELVSLAVQPAQQGKGLGRLLFGAAIDLAKRRGCAAMRQKRHGNRPFAYSKVNTSMVAVGPVLHPVETTCSPPAISFNPSRVKRWKSLGYSWKGWQNGTTLWAKPPGANTRSISRTTRFGFFTCSSTASHSTRWNRLSANGR